MFNHKKIILNLFIFFILLALPFHDLLAESQSVTTVAKSITIQATAIASLLHVTAYVSGVGFTLAGILQFKTHKENPQQTPLSKPVVMIVVAAALLFLPTVLDIAGNSLFGMNGISSEKAGGIKRLDGR